MEISFKYKLGIIVIKLMVNKWIGYIYICIYIYIRIYIYISINGYIFPCRNQYPIYPGKFDHDRNLFSRTLEIMVYFRESSPNGRTFGRLVKYDISKNMGVS